MITVKKFTFNPFQENSYILFDESKKCVVFDPGMYDEAERHQLVDFISNEKFSFGNSTLQMFFCPGHSPGSLCFYSKDDNFIIAGDVLFYQSIGRTDLPGGDYDTLINSIKSNLWSLPSETKVYNGHGQETSIGFEKENNPFLK